MDYIIPIFLFLLSGFYWMNWSQSRQRKNGFRKDLTETVIGQRTDEKVQRKARKKAFSDQTCKKTTVIYSYQVDGVTYACECVVLDHFQALPASTRVTYQRKNPQFSYLPDFEKPDEKGMQPMLLTGAIFFLLIGILAILRVM